MTFRFFFVCLFLSLFPASAQAMGDCRDRPGLSGRCGIRRQCSLSRGTVLVLSLSPSIISVVRATPYSEIWCIRYSET